jgi:predicted dehydrogenase
MGLQKSDVHYRNVLLVGGGAMGVIHVPRVLGLLGAESLCILETSEERRRFLQKSYKRDPRIAVFNKLPSSGRYDLAVVCTPPKYHYPYFAELLERADAFLIEKPMTILSNDARKILDESSKANKPVFVNLLRRSLKGYKLLRRFYLEEVFGPLESAEVHEGDLRVWQSVSKGSFSKELNGGGVLMDTGPHTLDLLLQVFEDFEVKEAYMDAEPEATEANCVLKGSADSRIPIVVNLSRNRQLSNQARFRFAGASISLGVSGNLLNVRDRRGLSYQLLPDGIRLGDEPPTYADLLDAFYVDHVVRGDNRGVSPSESLRVVDQMERAYAMALPLEGVF